jgi:hypothetical protein
MKARLMLLAIGMAMALLGCATRGVSDEQFHHLQIAQYSENGVITVSPDQVFEK